MHIGDHRRRIGTGDDQNPPLNETICANQPQWSDEGDWHGTDLTCTTDTDNDDPIDKDCGSSTNRTVAACSWISDPNCGSFLEHGSQGSGVWVREQFNLSAFAGRRARLRWLDQTGGGWGFGEYRSFLEPEPGGLPSQFFDIDDGWIIDDIRLTDLRTSAASINPDPTDGLSACPSQGDTNNCGVVNLAIAGSSVDTRVGATSTNPPTLVLRAQSGDLRTGITLDARQTTAADDPNSVAVERGCSSGVLQYQWSELNPNGTVARVIQPFSAQANIVVAVDHDTSYQVDARCSSDTGCASSRIVAVQVYTGDGSDINNGGLLCKDTTGNVVACGTVAANNGTTSELDGLTMDHDPNTNTATLTWRSRPQVSGESGFDVFKRDVSAAGTDIFAGNVFAGGACFQNAQANGAVGTLVTKTDTVMPATGHASLYMIGHSSTNTLAIAPLGFRPSVSTRANTLVSAAVTCP